MEGTGRKKKILFGILTVLISTMTAISIYHLWGTDWNVPLAGYRGDSIGLLLELSNFVRGGFVHHHIIYGEPYMGSFSGGLCDYSLLMPTLKLFWKITGSIEAAINMHAVMNCAVMSFCMFFVCIRLKIRNISSMIIGLLYGNLSFFYLYGNTVMMTYSASFYIPLFCYILLEVMREDGELVIYRIKDGIFVSIVMFYAGISSAYYAFFAMIILAFVALYVLFVQKIVDSVLLIIQSYFAIGSGIAIYTIPGILHRIGYTQIVLDMGYGLYVLLMFFAVLVLVGICAIVEKIHSRITIRMIYFIVAGFIILAGITYIILYKYTNYLGEYDGRTLYAVESGSLKAVSMVLPTVNSVFGLGASILEAVTDVSNRQASDFAMIGILAGIGFLYSIIHIFEYRQKDEAKDGRNEILKLCGLINCFIIVVAVKGGLSSVIAMFVTTGIRNYNRMCVFIAAFGLISLGIFIDKVTDKVCGISRCGVRNSIYIALGAVFVFGLCMSISTDFMYNHTFGFAEYGQRKGEYDEWKQYMEAIESEVPQNGMILELPLVMDENYMGELMTNGRAYELNIPVSISKTTYWNTGGGIRKILNGILDGNEGIDDFLTFVGAYGYEGIYLDKLMYPDDSYTRILKGLEQYLGEPLVCSESRRYFYSMADYNQNLHEQYTEKELEGILEKLQ